MVTLIDVIDLRLRQKWSNWPFSTLVFDDMSGRQLERIDVSVSDGGEGRLSCMCADVEVIRT